MKFASVHGIERWYGEVQKLPRKQSYVKNVLSIITGMVVNVVNSIVFS